MIKTCVRQPLARGKAGPFNLGQKTDYSLFFLTSLADGRQSSIRAIAKNGKLSFAFLQKVAHMLKKAGLVQASRGKRGGYTLARAPGAISLQEIIEATDGTIAIMNCLDQRHKKTSCPRQQFCHIRSALSRMNDEIRTQYYSKRLSDFISQPS